MLKIDQQARQDLWIISCTQLGLLHISNQMHNIISALATTVTDPCIYVMWRGVGRAPAPSDHFIDASVQIEPPLVQGPAKNKELLGGFKIFRELSGFGIPSKNLAPP